jgi:SAM-dependent methyltransferase
MPEPIDPDSTRRFTDRAADYAKFRPDYPASAIDAILGGLARPASLVAADVGAGTGISSRMLADRGVRVEAVEPNAAMRAAAARHPRVTWRDGTAERTGLADGSIDLVVSAQAFHWFDVAAAAAEFQRVLRAGGRLALMWNKRSRDDAFTLAYREALAEADAEPPAERDRFDPAVVTSTGRFGCLQHAVFPHAQRLSLDGLLGRVLSTSTVPVSGPVHDRLVERLCDLFARFRASDDTVALVYGTHVFLWTVQPAR